MQYLFQGELLFAFNFQSLYCASLIHLWLKTNIQYPKVNSCLFP